MITVKNLTLAYGATPVIKNASFKVRAGDFICVVGANGSGKSTLVKALLGLLKPASGEISYTKIEQTDIGYLPQENKISQIFPATVEEVVLSGNLGRMGRRAFYRSFERENAAKAMTTLGIADLRKESFASLSGGQKQKVLLARALTATDKLLILDEPSNNLDHQSRREFYETLRKLNREGLTIMMITHDLDQEDLIGDRVLQIANGTVSLATTEEFLGGFRS